MSGLCISGGRRAAYNSGQEGDYTYIEVSTKMVGDKLIQGIMKLILLVVH